MDVKTAFLNGFIKEELYMIQPEGFVNPRGANKICKLQRSIYGLVQASRSWNICFDQLIKAYIPTLRCLHQSIDGSLELAHFVSTFRIDKTFWLFHMQLFFNKSIKECNFVYPFARFHKNAAIANMIWTDLSIATSEKISS